MSASPDPIEALLASIADGTEPDWRSAEEHAAHRARVESLRAVASIADFSRAHQRAPAAGVVPERWGDLLLLERLSAGARAEVFRAWDPGLQREVALKLMREGPGDETLLLEGRVAARTRHANVVTVHGVDRRDGRVGLWMELLRGPTLEQEVRTRGPLGADEARRLGLEIGSALAAVHAAGLLHRDVKPSNVVRDADGRHVLADFGLGVRESDASAAHDRTSGTPMYMAPEMLTGGGASERSDLYSFGMLLWFALAGRHPFAVSSIADLREAAMAGPRPRLREVRPGLPAGIAAIVERAIDPRLESRFSSVRAMTEALEAWHPQAAARRGAGASRTWAVAAVLAVVAAAAIATFGPWRARRETLLTPAVPDAATTTQTPTAPASYAVEASFLRRDASAVARLVTGDRVKPGDRLSLEVRTTRPAWVYVLNEDDHGERYLLFPQPRLDAQNPLPADTTFVLPGALAGAEQTWTVTSAGGREHFLVVVSPEPVPEIEADLGTIPQAEPGRPIEYARVGERAIEHLRGVGGMAPLPAGAARPANAPRAFERFKALAGREIEVRGVFVRQIEFENPRR